MSEPSELGVVESVCAATKTSDGKAASSSPMAQVGKPIQHSAEFDACVEEIRKLYGSNIPFLFPRIEDRTCRRLGVAPLSVAAALVSGLVGVGIRLAVALGATLLVGEWAEIPWGRWAVILVFYALFDATQSWRTPPLDVPAGPTVRRLMEDYTALLPAIERESDLRDMAGFVRRWHRLLPAALAGLVIATAMVSACWLFTPTAMAEIPVGSIVLLIFLIYDVGAVMVYGSILNVFLRARQARYDHRLFWPSPADSPEVKRELKAQTGLGLVATGFWITVNLVLAVFLVSWDSPVVVPLAAGFIVAAYLITIGEALWVRSSIQKIVQRARERRLVVLRDRIDEFGPRFADLSTREAERLRDLMEVHNMIRDAPGTPTTARTLITTAVGVIVPTVMFLITVLGEVYAERFLDAILP